MKITSYSSPNTIAVKGFDALVEKLGPSGALQFINQYETGHGNYTVERKKLFKNYSLNDIKRKLI